MKDFPINQVLIGDALEQLRTLPDESVQCCITSPPYWGLRDYGTAEWEGGDADCKHISPPRGGTGEKSKIQGTTKNKETAVNNQYMDECKKCGAIRVDRQIGLEKTPEEYVEKMRQVFAEVRRVLRKDGTLWLNLGDSYAGSMKGVNADGEYHGTSEKQLSNKGSFTKPVEIPSGLKAKDLCGIPWRVAFALQSDGWYLRSDIIWAKPNPMPESVSDRPTKSHEYIFLLTKSAKYYYDAEAIKELSIYPDDDRKARVNPTKAKDHRTSETNRLQAGSMCYPIRNKRTVWQITTKPFSGAHFATFPPELPEICIKAGTSEKGCCAQCGGPWERVIVPSERYAKVLGKGYHNHSGDLTKGMKQVRGENIQNKMRDAGIGGAEYQTLGWQPTCKCKNTVTIPCIVLDPFAGAGTTLEVAKRLGRNYIGIELSEKYVRELIEPRLESVNPLFAKAV